MKKIIKKIHNHSVIVLLAYSCILCVLCLMINFAFSSYSLNLDKNKLNAQIESSRKIKIDLEKEIKYKKGNIFATFVGKMRKGRGFVRLNAKRVKSILSYHWQEELLSSNLSNKVLK